ncbi:excinuclease ABC subunit A [Halorhodospira abdelmalekii]|uniref:excinuclease ABC subunit UvrA n=1 Tax=Halorhodospira abdelmalekii TaxID=421629 RepID=UPI001902DE62|nr:excinuclease ABC subunit UvrA [Halorhodospira abdelmalekii]MBK1735253.1 excinuclease ABC subunit A [Halorhodospira abdelmalekii]
MDLIRIRGARTHNLRNVDVDLPRNRLIVITGPSGSGKSSLAFDTLYAEGQRRYVESLSAYARQFLSLMDKPDVDHISGLSPAIAVQQQTTGHNPRSTVATVTEIHDHLRLLFARVGTPLCPTHGTALEVNTVTQMVERILSEPDGTKMMLLAPLAEAGEEGQRACERLRAQGFIRVRLDGEVYELDALPPAIAAAAQRIEAVVDRFRVRPDLASRLADSLETTLAQSAGLALVAWIDEPQRPALRFSTRRSCPECGYSTAVLEPRMFSFNNPEGACPSCDGLGYTVRSADSADAADAAERADAAVAPSQKQCCPSCAGARLNERARHVAVAGHRLPELSALSIAEAHQSCCNLGLSGARAEIAAPIVDELERRLRFLDEVGLGYLTLDRPAGSLSGGEAQRIRLASQIGAGLVGVLYVLDEPSIGLHPRDHARLLESLCRLRDLGNTVVVVEHEESAMRAADFLLDMGPGAGVHGGQVVASGTPAAVAAAPDSLTGAFLSGHRRISLPPRRSTEHAPTLTLHGASGHNLQGLDVAIPCGVLTCVTGVSGSGKSTLINDTLYRCAARELNGARTQPAAHDHITGLHHFDQVVAIDQRPIGRTPRSNPATYTGLFGPLRELLAATPEARARGYTPGRFSFNVRGGRCEVCQGEGVKRVAMHLLPDLHVTCDACNGARFNRETLEIRYRGYNVAALLALTVEQARDFFAAIPAIARRLDALCEVGLDYLHLGQSATTLSGGEAQRVKLARELARREHGRTLYILDEPTTGLHFTDVEQLLGVLQRLCDHGNTVVVVEHDLDVIKSADWVIDLGPDGGGAGGQLIAAGPPEHVAASSHGHTAGYLRRALAAAGATLV